MEMEFEQINLNWEKHESTISQGFQALREAKELFDVTLACKDGRLEAHKVILSSCSPRFKEILKEKVPAYSTIYLHGLELHHLEAVVDFMYRGRVVIEKRGLDDFLNLAREWQVKGLSLDDDESQMGNPTDEPELKASLKFRKPEDLLKPAVLIKLKKDQVSSGSRTRSKLIEDNMVNEISTLQSLLEKQKVENEELQTRNTSNEERYNILMMAKKDVENKLEEVNAKASGAQAEVKDREAMVANLLMEKAALQKESDVWKKRGDLLIEKINLEEKLQGEKVKLTRMVQSLTGKIKHLNGTMDATKIELQASKVALAESQKKVEKQSSELEILANERESLMQENSNSKAIQSSLESQVHAMEKKIGDLEEGVNTHRKTAESLKSKEKALREELDVTVKMLEAANEASNNNTEMKMLELQVAEKEKEWIESKATISTQQETISTQQTTILQLKKIARRFREQKDDCEKEKETAVQENKERERSMEGKLEKTRRLLYDANQANIVSNNEIAMLKLQISNNQYWRRAEYRFCWRWNEGHCRAKECKFPHRCSFELKKGTLCGSRYHGECGHNNQSSDHYNHHDRHYVERSHRDQSSDHHDHAHRGRHNQVYD